MPKANSLLIDGGPGTGKSYFQKRTIEQLSPGGHCLYFGFTRTHLNHRNQFFTIRNTFTIHSAAFMALRVYNRLPPSFKYAMKLPMTAIDLELLGDETRIDYAELLTAFQNDLTDEEICEYFGHIEVIAVDEVQDLSPELWEVIKRFTRIYDCPVILAGDDFQKIYTFNKDPRCHNIRQIANQLGVERVITLNENKRNPENSEFLNGYYRTNFPDINPDYLYKVPDVLPTRPEIHFFQNPTAERQHIQNLIAELGPKVTVLSRNKDFLSWLSLPPSIRQSTIHAFKGDEADVIILAGFPSIDLDDVDELKVWGVAISRARKRLIITTPFPEGKISARFDIDTLQLFDHTNLKYPLRRLRGLSLPGFNGCIPFNKSSIDSCVWQVSEKDAPFWPYVSHDAPIQRTLARRCKSFTSAHGIPYMVSRFHRKDFSGHYAFHFLDLNRLRNSGYNDLQILNYCRNIMLEYFDGRVDDTQIELVRLDLGKALRFRSKTKALQYREMLYGAMKKASGPPVLLQNIPGVDQKKSTYQKVAFTPENFASMNHSVYFNYRKKRGGNFPATFVLYNPSNKDNANAFPTDDNHYYTKAELKLKGRDIIGQKRALGNTTSLADLKRIVRVAPDGWYRPIFIRFLGCDPFEIFESMKE